MLSDQQAQNIQGIGIAGFRKDFQQLIFIRIDDPAGARSLIAQLASRTANAFEVRQFNQLYSEIDEREQDRDPLDTVRATWIGTLISANGYRKLGVNLGELPPGDGSDAFNAGMESRASTIGDTRDKDAPAGWIAEFRADHGGVDMLVVAASDDEAQLEQVCQSINNLISDSGCVGVFDERGATLLGPLRGHEHFGFKDGISQPKLIDFGDTAPEAGEPPAVAIGEFVLGYSDNEGQTAAVGDLWQDGSFAVFRRLRQDVIGFRELTAAGVPAADPALDAPTLGAKLVGRWPSGAPLALSPTADSGVVSNAFQYEASDADGQTTPRFAHIRKANPRDELPLSPDPATTERHRMLRRGAPFGPALDPAATTDDGVARGLHFLSVVSDVARQFEFVQANWINNPNFPNGTVPAVPTGLYGPPSGGEPADGPDPIVGEFDSGSSDALHQPNGVHQFPLASELVSLTAGEYFFAPSISALGRLGSGATASTSAPTPSG